MELRAYLVLLPAALVELEYVKANADLTVHLAQVGQTHVIVVFLVIIYPIMLAMPAKLLARLAQVLLTV